MSRVLCSTPLTCQGTAACVIKRFCPRLLGSPLVRKLIDPDGMQSGAYAFSTPPRPTGTTANSPSDVVNTESFNEMREEKKLLNEISAWTSSIYGWFGVLRRYPRGRARLRKIKDPRHYSGAPSTMQKKKCKVSLVKGIIRRKKCSPVMNFSNMINVHIYTFFYAASTRFTYSVFSWNCSHRSTFVCCV